MKYKLSVLFLSMFLMQSIFAITSIPPKCPDLAAIKSTKIDKVGKSFSGWMAVIFSNNFNTNNNWSFSFYFHPKDEKAVMNEANTMLQTFYGEPQADNESGVWTCQYNSPAKSIGIASNPPIFLN